MIEDYFENFGVRDDFSKEYVSLWPGWLGKHQLHKLDEVTETEWQRFNELLRALFSKYELYAVNLTDNEATKVNKADDIIDSYERSRNKGENDFTKLIIPELEAVYSEEWDYTWIIWHKQNHAVDHLAPLINACQLHHFNDATK